MTEQPQTEQPLRVVVFADFVCPYSYLAVDQIDRLASEYGVRPLWRPYWLHPETPPEGTPCARPPEKMERLRAWIKDMAPEHLERIRIPEKRQYSFLAFEALEFAYDHGLDLEFKTALYEAMWTEGKDIGDVETVLGAAEKVGLDTAALDAALAAHTYAERTVEAIQQARDIGVTNTPTIFIGRTRINGWTYFEVLQSVIAQEQAKQREAVSA